MNSENLTSTDGNSQRNSELEFFCYNLFGGTDVSFRCVAEAPELKEKLKKLSAANSGRLDIVKLLYHETPFPARVEAAHKWNAQGYAIYYLPQLYTPGYDESYSAITQFRAFVIDLDGAPIEPVQQYELPPSLIIESSPGKYQAIWKLTAGIGVNYLSVDQYNDMSSKLAALFDADLNVARATQAFRAPGFLHTKKGLKNGFAVHILPEYLGCSIAEYSLHQIKGCLKVRSKKASATGTVGTEGGGRSNGNGTHANPQTSDSGNAASSAVNIPLDPLILGVVEGKVGLGQRHSTLLKVQTKLLHNGLDASEVEAKCMEIVKQSFENPQDFLPGGVRELEMKRSLQDAQGYVKEAKIEEDLAVREVLESVGIAEAGSESSESVEAGESYDYNFSSRSLSISKYTETAVVWRTLQRFNDDLARVDGRPYCFNRQDKLWIPQTAMWFGETKQRVESCVSDMVAEKGFSASLIDDKGKLSRLRVNNAIAHFYSLPTLNGISRGVLNNMAVRQYDYSDFDAQPALLYCANGVVDLMTGEIRDARNEDRLLNRTSISWSGSAECTRWLVFLGQVFAENNDPADMIRFTQELFGYSLSGWINEERLFCHQGDGANGKSKLLSALRLVAGNYATIVEPEELVVKRGGFGKAFERTGAKVEGKRCVIIDDFEVDSEWNEAFVKLLTGPSIRARGEYEKSRVAPNRAKFHIGLNKAPRPEAENLGILRRLCIIPYPRTFEVDPDKSREIDKMIASEAPGILRWAAEGLRRARNGIAYPAETTAALEEYRVENFKLEAVVGDMFDIPQTELEPGASWELVSKLAEEVSTELHKRIGNSSMYISPDMLGIALRRAGAQKRKMWNGDARNTLAHVLVKLKYQRSVTDSVL